MAFLSYMGSRELLKKCIPGFLTVVTLAGHVNMGEPHAAPLDDVALAARDRWESSITVQRSY